MTAAVAVADDPRLEYLSLLEEKARRLAERSLMAFIRQAWPIVEPSAPFRDNWHIDAIAEHLEAVTRGEIQHLLINVPPGCMKSYIVSVLWPAWEWATAPWRRYLCVSFDQGLTIRDNKRVRDLVMSDWYQARWPNVVLASDQNQKTRYDTTAGGWRIASSVRGKGLGEHPHRKIVDDPHNTKEVTSDVERQAAIDFFDQTLTTRGAALNAATVVIMQRLHEQDLSGHILNGPTPYVHLCLPMRHEVGRQAVTPIGWTDPRQQAGELLWPEMFPPSLVSTLQTKLGSYGAAGQLQQRPAPAEGGIIKRHWWKYYAPDTPISVDRVVLSWDTALKGKQLSDFSVGQVWGAKGANRFLLRGVRGRWEFVELRQQVRDLYRWARETYRDSQITVLIENTAAGPDVIAALRHEIPGIVAVRPKGDKVQRTFAVTPAIEAGNVFVPGAPSADQLSCDAALTPGWVQDFLVECASFPNGAVDDQVDACTQALLRLQTTDTTVGAARFEHLL
jgi:predicted phage terminase large subunit-like protein